MMKDQEIFIIKRDGTEEPFDSQKIVRVVKAAGLDDSTAEDLSSKITSWVQNLGKPKISSLEVRDQVVNELQKVDEYAYNLFVWYQKTKEH